MVIKKQQEDKKAPGKIHTSTDDPSHGIRSHFYFSQGHAEGYAGYVVKTCQNILLPEVGGFIKEKKVAFKNRKSKTSYS